MSEQKRKVVGFRLDFDDGTSIEVLGPEHIDSYFGPKETAEVLWHHGSRFRFIRDSLGLKEGDHMTRAIQRRLGDTTVVHESVPEEHVPAAQRILEGLE